MAKITMHGLDDYFEKLSQLALRTEGIIKLSVYPAAGTLIEAIKANTPARTGDLREATFLKEFKTKGGFTYTQVGWAGYDRFNVPNPIKVHVLESGSSKQQKRPFIRQTVNKVRKQLEAEIADNLDKNIDKIMK